MYLEKVVYEKSAACTIFACHPRMSLRKDIDSLACVLAKCKILMILIRCHSLFRLTTMGTHLTTMGTPSSSGTVKEVISFEIKKAKSSSVKVPALAQARNSRNAGSFDCLICSSKIITSLNWCQRNRVLVIILGWYFP